MPKTWRGIHQVWGKMAEMTEGEGRGINGDGEGMSYPVSLSRSLREWRKGVESGDKCRRPNNVKSVMKRI